MESGARQGKLKFGCLWSTYPPSHHGILPMEFPTLTRTRKRKRNEMSTNILIPHLTTPKPQRIHAQRLEGFDPRRCGRWRRRRAGPALGSAAVNVPWVSLGDTLRVSSQPAVALPFPFSSSCLYSRQAPADAPGTPLIRSGPARGRLLQLSARRVFSTHRQKIHHSIRDDKVVLRHARGFGCLLSGIHHLSVLSRHRIGCWIWVGFLS